MAGYYKFNERKTKFSRQKETADIVALRSSETLFAVFEMNNCHAGPYNLVPFSRYAVFSIE